MTVSAQTQTCRKYPCFFFNPIKSNFSSTATKLEENSGMWGSSPLVRLQQNQDICAIPSNGEEGSWSAVHHDLDETLIFLVYSDLLSFGDSQLLCRLWVKRRDWCLGWKTWNLGSSLTSFLKRAPQVPIVSWHLWRRSVTLCFYHTLASVLCFYCR